MGQHVGITSLIDGQLSGWISYVHFMQGTAKRIGQEFKRRFTEMVSLNHNMLSCTSLISNAMAEGPPSLARSFCIFCFVS